MKFRLRLFDFLIFFIFAAIVFFSFEKVFGSRTAKKTLIVQIKEKKYAYSLEKELHLEFEGLIGKSHITVSDGKAWFEDSPCSNKVCVEAGKISEANQWAACLPNGIIIYIEGQSEKEEVDAVAN